MKPDFRALAQLIVYLFLSFHAVTWAGDRDPGHHLALAAHVQTPMAFGGGVELRYQTSDVNLLLKDRMKRLNQCWKHWKRVANDANVPQVQRNQLWKIYTSLLRGQEVESAPVPTLDDNEDFEQTLKTVIECLDESLEEPRIKQDPALELAVKSHKSFASLKKKQLEQASQGQTLNAQDSQALWGAEQDFMSTQQQSVAGADEGDWVADIYGQEEARLRGQVIEKQADPQAHYQYATHLCQHQLDSKSRISYQNHLLIAAEAGHVEAARQLLNQFQPGYYPSAGAVFFQLYQLGGEGQAAFCEVARARFLMHAIEAENIGALDYLNQLTHDTLKKNRKSGKNHRHPEWKNVRRQWLGFENRGERVNQLITEIDGMYGTGVHYPLPLLKERYPLHQPDTDSDSEDTSPREQALRHLQVALASQQTELETIRTAKQQTEAQLQALNVEHQADCLAHQESMAALSREKEALASALEISQQQQTDAERTIAQLKKACLERQQSGEQQAQEIVALREQLAQLVAEKAEQAPAESMAGQAYQLGQPGDPGFGVGAVPEGCLPPDFSSFPGSEEIDSDEYGNYRHAVAGVHVWIPAFVYRVSAAATLFQQYGAHALEVQDLGVYLSRLNLAQRAGLIEDLAQGKPGPEGWQLHRAFVNAGAVQAGFFIQKYLASKHSNGRSVTSQPNTVPLSLTTLDGYTRSKDMKGCAGILGDVYVLAKQTSDVHQVASIFQYSALTMLSLAQAQGAGSNRYCAWWSADAKECCPKGCAQDLHDEQKVNLGWQSAGERSDPNKPLTGSCSDPAWASHNGQGNGVMDIKGALWEVAGGVTTGSDTDNPQTLWALAREVDYIALDQDTAFGTVAQLQARGDVPVPLPYSVNRLLDGTFPLFSGDGAYDALALPKSVDAEGLVWPGYDDSRLYTEYTFVGLMPVVGGCWGGGAGLCARDWGNCWDYLGDGAGLRLAAYGLTWTELAGASGASLDDNA